MKRKILVPMFASVMALSMNSISNADEIKDNNIENNNEEKTTEVIDLEDFKEASFKVAYIKDGVATKVRRDGLVQTVAYSGDEFKVVGTQGDWVKVKLEDGEGWIASRFVDIKEAIGYTNSDKVNFRKESNVDSEIISELEIGSSVKVLESNENWLKVKKGEDEGYIRALYVSEEAPVIEEVESEDIEDVKEVETVISSDTVDKSSNIIKSNTNKNTENSNSGQAQKPVQQVQKPVQKPQNNNESYNPPASNSSKAQAVVNLAYSKIGSPYVWGAEGPNSFDCSGLTSYVFRNAAGVSLPRTSSAQAGFGKTVSRANLQPGDLVFFNTNGSGVSHVGIYVGGGKMVHAPSSGKSVTTADINSSYYSSRFVTAKRVL